MDSPAKSTITLNLRELAQLFNAMDSSPFVERDLEAEAEEFITSWARELPPSRQLELVLRVSTPSSAEALNGVEPAVRRYFATRAAIKRLEFGQLMRRGRLSLGVGLIFLVLCLLLSELVSKSSLGAATDIIKEGLTICGWVAMWRPLEICLYDWWPLYEERCRLDGLALIRVHVVTVAPRAPTIFDGKEYAHSDSANAAA